MSAPDATDPAVAYTAEHRAIDAEIERFLDAPDDGAALRTALDTLRRHIYLEEKFMFPPLRAAGLMMPIMVMIREHGEMWRLMDMLTAELADGRDPGRLRGTLAELTDLLERHNSKEEPVIYPHADHDMPPQSLTKLLKFLETGRTPDDWVCQQAGG